MVTTLIALNDAEKGHLPLQKRGFVWCKMQPDQVYDPQDGAVCAQIVGKQLLVNTVRIRLTLRHH